MPRRKLGPRATIGRGKSPKQQREKKKYEGPGFERKYPDRPSSPSNPIVVYEVKSGGMAGKKSGPPPKSGPTPHGMRDGGDAKIKKVIGGLKKASKLHAGQAKTLSSVIKKAKGGIATGCGKVMGDRRKVTKYF